MQKAKPFMFVCIGLLALAIAYHLGARSAGAQVGSMVTGVTFDPGASVGGSNELWVMTANGDIYGRQLAPGHPSGALVAYGNFWTGADLPIPVRESTWGQLKAKYRAPSEGR